VIRRRTSSLLGTLPTRMKVLLLALGLVLAGFLPLELPAAQAREDISISVTPSAVSAGPGESLSVTLIVINKGGTSLAAGEAIITAPSAALETVQELDLWFSGNDGLSRPGRYLISADIPEVPAGQKVEITLELPLSAGRFGNTWGVRGLAADLDVDGESVASGRSSLVWTPSAAPSLASFVGILPLVPAPSSSGILTSPELAELTGPSGLLTRQLAVASGRPVAVGVDPRIMTSIEILGESAPESALAWLAQLKALPNETFLLSYADADIAAQAQAGATSLLIPPTNDLLTSASELVPGEESTQNPTATPTSSPAVSAEKLPLFSPTIASVGWPAQASVIASDLGIFSASGIQRLILSSGNVAGESSFAGVAGGMPSVMTLDGLSKAVLENNVSRAASYVAVAATDSSTGGKAFTSLPREEFSITALGKLQSTLDAIRGLPWVVNGSLSASLSGASSPLEIVDKPESSQRIAVVSSLLARNAQVGSFATIAENPSLITNPATRDLAAVLSVGWLGSSDWEAAVSEHLRSTQKILNSVSIVTSSTINMVGGQANIPISVLNSLLQPVTVVVNADPNNARLVVNGSAQVTIQPESQGKAQIPVEAQVSNGSSILAVSLQSIEGLAVGEPVAIPINVRADWETWGLGAVALAFVGLLAAGVIRTVRRRKQGISLPE
jgi:hypothetical protein